jgi:glycerophosphoryl diester phosphodiesterase
MTLNIAHRGARSLAPENTLAAARQGLALGADLWETDVTVTRDGILILMHDDTLVRTTDAAQKFPQRNPWTVSQFSLAEIQTLNAGSWFTATDPFGQIAAGAVSAADCNRIKTARVPTLEQALVFTQNNNWRINLELKPIAPPMDRLALVEQTLALIAALEVDLDRIVISSFHHPWLHEIAAGTTAVAVQALVGWGNREVLDGRALAFDVYNISRRLANKDRIAGLLAQGKQINVYTVNEQAEMRALIDAGVQGLFTDFPQRLARVLKSVSEF